MKRFKLILFLAVIFVSCQKSDLYPDYDLASGQPSTLKLHLEDGELATKGTGLSDSQEKSIASVRVLVFDATGKVVTNQHFASYDSANGIESINTRSGVNMSVYAIANISAENTNFSSMFDNIATIGDLNAIKVYNIGSDVIQNSRLMMWGVKTGVTIPPLPATTSISFPLNYVASKVKVIVVDDTPVDENLSWVDWQMLNVARFSYLVGQATDAVSSSSPADYVATTASFAWNDTIVGGKSAKYTVFYLFENRRGGRVANASTPPAGYTPGAIGGIDARDKSWYAPQMATALVANGFYHTATAQTGIVAKIYLGANSYNDYNVERTNNYVHTITVKGIAQIDVDSRIDGNNSGFKADILSTTLDCHYDWRPIRLQSFGGTLKIELLNNDNITTPSWLKLSTLNLNQFISNGASYIRPTYNPVTDMKSTIDNIVFANSTTIASQMFYLYADQYNVENGTRTAKVKITSSQSGSLPIFITITQKGYQTMGDVGLRKFSLLGGVLPSESYKLAVENFEEATLNLTPGVANGVERTNTMQWGFYNVDMQPITVGSVLFDNYLRNGYTNSANLVMANTTTGALRTPYGRTGTSTISEQIHNPIFNSSAARYCFEKNRDVNGDGVIVGAEVEWYLPSLEELMLIYVGEPALNQSVGIKMSVLPYQSSTEYITTTDNMGVNFTMGRTGTLAKSTAINVRCVKAIN